MESERDRLVADMEAARLNAYVVTYLRSFLGHDVDICPRPGGGMGVVMSTEAASHALWLISTRRPAVTH